MCPAYALRADYEDTFAGGIINGPNGDIDVAAELEAGDGTILVEDGVPQFERLVELFDSYPALKRVKAPERVDGNYDGRHLDELRREAKRRGLEGLSSKTKADITAALEQDDEARKGA